MYSNNVYEEYSITDILHNDQNSLVIITTFRQDPLNIKFNSLSFDIYKCADIHTIAYILKDQIYTPKIILNINNKDLSVDVNKYPSFDDEIILSTCVKNEDEYIVQWINYHKLMGVTRFIIYDNKDNTNAPKYYIESKQKDGSNLPELLKKYIEDKVVVLINWNVKSSKFQQLQGTHVINTFKNCKYIGIMDIDEYLNSQIETINLNDIFNKHLSDINKKREDIGGIAMYSKFFNNPHGMSEKGYDFLKIFNCEYIRNVIHVINEKHTPYQKCFIVPNNVNTYSVHIITNGLDHIFMNEKYLYMNHYFFLNKKDRGRNNSPLIDDSISRMIPLLN